MFIVSYLYITLCDKVIAGDEVRDYALRPRVRPLAFVERHHELPQVRPATLSEVLQHTSRQLPLIGLNITADRIVNHHHCYASLS